MPLTRRKAILGGAGVLVALAAALGVVTFVFASVHGDLQLPHQNHVWLKDPITIKFDQAIDTSQVKLSLTPSTPFTLVKNSDSLLLQPKAAWLPARHYLLELGNLQNARHTTTLTGWHATFVTQDDVRVKGFSAPGDALPAGAETGMKLGSALTITFSTAMNPSTVNITVNGLRVGQPASTSSATTSPTAQGSGAAKAKASPKASATAPASLGTLTWSAGNAVATFTPARQLPGQVFAVSVHAGYSAAGDPLLEAAAAKATTLGLEPSNGNGIGDSFKTLAPLEIVVENSDPARPQNGLQQADMVFEYISEYSISRMTAFYFNGIPGLVGPVRSCRLINIPLNHSFHGYTMCSGASNGTINQLYSTHTQVVINDWDRANHFYRVGFKFAPHNVYTDPAHALKLRTEWGPGSNLDYTIDPAHPDVVAGDPVGPPAVPLHGVTYAYNASGQTYARFDEGAPFIDGNTNRQLQVKNVILVHVGYEVMNYVEDENGGARSIHYDMVGYGPAEIYSDGHLIHATWQMGDGVPMYFTDAQGNFIRLNSGLTWIHVLGNGQNG